MIDHAQTSPHRLPSVASWVLRPLPLLPLRLVLVGLAASIMARHPELHERLEAYHGHSIGIEPTDAPFAVLIEASQNSIALRVERRLAQDSFVAAIRGPLLALLGLLDGSYDGDALFFSRDISINGDVGAILALRNAVDDAQINLHLEFSACFGPLAAAILDAAKRQLESVSETWSRRQMTR